MAQRERKSGERRESFFSNHVRLVTCILVVAVFLMGFALLEIYVHQDYIFVGGDEDSRPEMTVELLESIGKKPTLVTGAMLDDYKGENYDRRIDGIIVEKYYYVNGIGGRYNLSATERVTDGKIMFLEIFDMETKEKIDLLDKEADFDAFFQQ